MIVRLYTGRDGQSHFEDLNIPAGEVENVALKPGADMTFRRAPDGRFSSWHNAPRRQYVIILSGQMEIGIGDGTARRLKAGDILLAEDLTGQGHTTRAVGGPRVSVSVPLAG
jgi:quercetin dioxygenase-like cupin family protein